MQDVQVVIPRVAELANFERRARALVQVALPEVRLAEGQVDEGATGAEDSGWRGQEGFTGDAGGSERRERRMMGAKMARIVPNNLVNLLHAVLDNVLWWVLG